MALGSGAHITAVDVSAERTTIGQRFLKKAGVAVGGVTGGVLGAAGSQDHFSQRTYDQVYWNCINRSRFRAYDRPIRYSRNRDWCSSRYRSYNPDTGLYMSSSGRYRHCR